MAKVSVLLEKLAAKLEDPNSDLVVASEENEHVLNIVTFALVQAAAVLKHASKEVLKFEPHIDSDDLDALTMVASDFDKDEETAKYAESVDNLLSILGQKQNLNDDLENAARLAHVLDDSGDDSLAKIASVLDEILLTIGAPKGANYTFKSAEEAEIEKLRKKYKTDPNALFTAGEEAKQKLTDEYLKEINNKVKQYKPMEHPLNARCCPDHPSQMLMRVGEGVWQCIMDKKIYDYKAGYTLMDGDKVPGTSVSNQTQNLGNVEEHVNFSTREQRLNG